jgi:hypothetical protein
VLVPHATTEADLRREKRNRALEFSALMAMFVLTGVLAWYLRLWKFVA